MSYDDQKQSNKKICQMGHSRNKSDMHALQTSFAFSDEKKQLSCEILNMQNIVDTKMNVLVQYKEELSNAQENLKKSIRKTNEQNNQRIENFMLKLNERDLEKKQEHKYIMEDLKTYIRDLIHELKKEKSSKEDMIVPVVQELKKALNEQQQFMVDERDHLLKKMSIDMKSLLQDQQKNNQIVQELINDNRTHIQTIFKENFIKQEEINKQIQEGQAQIEKFHSLRQKQKQNMKIDKDIDILYKRVKVEKIDTFTKAQINEKVKNNKKEIQQLIKSITHVKHVQDHECLAVFEQLLKGIEVFDNPDPQLSQGLGLETGWGPFGRYMGCLYENIGVLRSNMTSIASWIGLKIVQSATDEPLILSKFWNYGLLIYVIGNYFCVNNKDELKRSDGIKKLKLMYKEIMAQRKTLIEDLIREKEIQRRENDEKQ